MKKNRLMQTYPQFVQFQENDYNQDKIPVASGGNTLQGIACGKETANADPCTYQNTDTATGIGRPDHDDMGDPCVGADFISTAYYATRT